jgi:putative tryptophan/tyrosine transport system substrate-binding protein
MLDVRRREFIAFLGGAAAACPLSARAQQSGGRVYRIGILGATSLPVAQGLVDAFRDGLRERGYVEGQNLAIDYRAPAVSSEQGPDLAVELVRGGADVILAWTTPSLIAARRATSTVPIVIVGVADPVGLGLVASLARPGGNVTGITNFASDLSGKMIELLTEIAPGLRRLGVVRNPDNPGVTVQLRQTEAAAHALRLEFQVVDARVPAEFEAAFAQLRAAGAQGVVLLADSSLIEHASKIAALAQQARLPTAFQRRENVDAGGLLSYGPSLRNAFRQAAGHVDRILKGAKPADIPVEQPTKLELIINLKTAKALGLDVPWFLQQRADEVIE